MLFARVLRSYGCGIGGVRHVSWEMSGRAASRVTQRQPSPSGSVRQRQAVASGLRVMMSRPTAAPTPRCAIAREEGVTDPDRDIRSRYIYMLPVYMSEISSAL